MYDGRGNRTEKAGLKFYWYGLGSQVLDESDTTGNVTDEYVYLGSQRVAHVVVSGGSVYFYGQDHLGTSHVMVAAGATSPCYDADFYPFGGERAYTTTCTQNYKFTGKERDAESGLDNFGARYNSSSIGRFMSPDAALADQHSQFPQSWNLYSYTRNNALNGVDPNGRGYICVQCVADAVHSWWTGGVARDGGVGNFAKNNAIGAAKGTGTVAFNTLKVAAAASQNYANNPIGAEKTMAIPTPSALQPSNQTQAQTSTATQTALPLVIGALSGGLGAAESATSAAAPSMIGFSEAEAGMITQSMQNLAGAGYDLGPFQQLIKADMPADYFGMSLSTPPTGAALGDAAFSSQDTLDSTLEEELLHLNQNLSTQTFGPGTAAQNEAAVDSLRQLPASNGSQ